MDTIFSLYRKRGDYLPGPSYLGNHLLWLRKPKEHIDNLSQCRESAGYQRVTAGKISKTPGSCWENNVCFHLQKKKTPSLELKKKKKKEAEGWQRYMVCTLKDLLVWWQFPFRRKSLFSYCWFFVFWGMTVSNTQQRKGRESEMKINK